MPSSQIKTNSLAGKNAVVTGASRGIGAAIALELANRGANVLVHYSSSEKPASELVSKIQSLGLKSDKVKADLAEKSVGETIATKASEWAKASGGSGKVDILVLNGAVAHNLELEKLNTETIDENYTKQMDINVRSTILIVNAILPHLGNPSRITLLSSVSARGGFPTQTVYGATKAALEHFARVWAKELGHKYGATVNCVNPGPVETDMWYSTSDQFRAGIKFDTTPAAPRIGAPDDIAQAVAFLSEESSRWVTGSVLSTSGGMISY